MPEGFRNILLPTLKNYYDFVLVLEKIIVHKFLIKHFKKMPRIYEVLTARMNQAKIKEAS